MKTENYRGYKIEIRQDDQPESPREWDNCATMVCSHRRYDLGDKQVRDMDDWILSQVDYDDDGEGEIDMDEALQLFKKDNYVLPLYLYDHSGITMKTTPFDCVWDSGCVGLAYISKDDALKYWSEDTEKNALECIVGEVGTYDQFLRGEIYSYKVEDIDESCCGFYGYEAALEEAKEAIDWAIQCESKKHAKYLKKIILSKVPLQYRTAHPVH